MNGICDMNHFKNFQSITKVECKFVSFLIMNFLICIRVLLKQNVNSGSMASQANVFEIRVLLKQNVNELRCTNGTGNKSIRVLLKQNVNMIFGGKVMLPFLLEYY